MSRSESSYKRIAWPIRLAVNSFHTRTRYALMHGHTWVSYSYFSCCDIYTWECRLLFPAFTTFYPLCEMWMAGRCKFGSSPSGLHELLLAVEFVFLHTDKNCPSLQQIQYCSREAACYELKATSVLSTYLWASADVTSKASCSRQPPPCRWNSAMPVSGSTLAMTLPLRPAQGTPNYVSRHKNLH